jgi:hypothetical protein
MPWVSDPWATGRWRVSGRDQLRGQVGVRFGRRRRHISMRRRHGCAGGDLRRYLGIRNDLRFRLGCGRVRYLGLGLGLNLGLDLGVSQRLSGGARCRLLPGLGTGFGVRDSRGHFLRIGPGVGHVLRPPLGIRCSRGVGGYLRVQEIRWMGRPKAIRQFILIRGVVPAGRSVSVGCVVSIGGTVGIGRVLVVAHDVGILGVQRPDVRRPDVRRLTRVRRLGT